MSYENDLEFHNIRVGNASELHILQMSQETEFHATRMARLKRVSRLEALLIEWDKAAEAVQERSNDHAWALLQDATGALRDVAKELRER